MIIPTEEQLNAEYAAEIVTILTETETGKKSIAVLSEDCERIVHELDKHAALAVAVRLIELSTQLPAPPRILRRSSEIEDELRDRDGGV